MSDQDQEKTDPKTAPRQEPPNFLNEFTPASEHRVATSLDDPIQAMRLQADSATFNELPEEGGIPIQDVILADVQIVDRETGVVTSAVRSVIITPDGRGYATVSAGVLQSLQQLSQIYGPPPWSPALNLELLRRKTNSGFIVFRLVPVLVN